MSFIKILERINKFIVMLSAATGCILLIINIIDIMIGVAARQTGYTSIVWTEEAARFALVWFVLIGASAAFYEGDNMSIDFITKRLSPRVQAFLKFIAVIIETIVLFILIFYGIQNVNGGWTMKTMALQIPRAVPLMAVPVGAGMLLIVLISSYLIYLLSRKNKIKNIK